LEEESRQREEEEKRKTEEKENLLKSEPGTPTTPYLLNPREKKFKDDFEGRIETLLFENEDNHYTVTIVKILQTIISNVNESDLKFRQLKFESKKNERTFEKSSCFQDFKVCGISESRRSLINSKRNIN